MNLIYSNSSKTAMEAAFATNGIFIPQKDCISETFVLAFGTTFSQIPTGDTLSDALSRLELASLLKTNFNSAKEQKRLTSAMRRIVMVHLFSNSYFGFSDTINIYNELSGNSHSDYSLFFTEPHLAFLPAFSGNVFNKLAIGYSHIIREYLTRDIIKDIISEVQTTFNSFEPSSTSLEPLGESFDRFKRDLLNIPNFHIIYEN